MSTKPTKQPLDESMLDTSDHMMEWFHRHGTLVSTVVLIAALAFVGWKGYSYMQASKTAEAGRQLSRAQGTYNVAIRTPEKAQRDEMLATAVNDTQRIATEFPGTYAAKQALLIEGNAHYYKGLLAEQAGDEAREALRKAREAFEKYVQQSTDPTDKAVGNLALAQTLENLLFSTRDLQLGVEAGETYKEVIKLAPDSYLAGEANLGLARLLQNQKGRQGEAKKHYDDVIASRVPEEVSTATVSQSVLTDAGITSEEVAEIRGFSQLTQAARAKEMMSIMRGLPSSPIEE